VRASIHLLQLLLEMGRAKTLDKLIACVASVAFAASLMGNASAESADVNAVMNDRFVLYLGGFFPQVSSESRINGDQIGDIIDFENAFGLEDSKSVLWGGARWRISRRNSLEFEFSNLNRDGSVTWTSDPIQIGDSLVQAGAKVDSTFDVTLGRLTYGFSVIKKEKHELQLKAGLHIADLGVSMGFTGAVCVDGEVPPNCSIFVTEPRDEGESVTAPLPHFGLNYTYAFSPTVAARLQAIGFALEIDDIDGSLFEVDADVLWTPWEHFGFGAGLRYFRVDVESTGSSLNGKFEFKYYGPAVYGVVTF